MMRLAAYAGASTALGFTVVLKALHQRANFYSACVYLSQSNANLMILTNLVLLVVGFCLFGLQRLLYGRLRPIETEQLYEKAWFAVTETCLAMTIFRGELGGWFVVMFVCLLVGKIWGWIGEGRVDVLEQQPPNNPRLFHTRLAVSLLLAVLFDSFMLEYAVKTVLRQARPDMMVMFGFEFAVLTILSTSTTARYALSLTEIYIVRQQKRTRVAERKAELRASREEILRTSEAAGTEPPPDLPNEDEVDDMELDVPGWEEKGRFVFYLNLITDFLKLVVYLSFFAILFTFYGLPIHILRDVVLTTRSFIKRILDFIRYRNATRDMNQRYPDATAEEIAREDVCIICREEMRPWNLPENDNAQPAPARAAGRVPERLRPKRLPCGHLLHFACLRSWLERQQNCPTCRRPVTTGGRVNGEGENVPGRGNHRHGGNAMGGRPRTWELNLGPLRVGFGAGRRDQFQEMAHQFNAGQAPVNRALNPNPNRANQASTSSRRSSPSPLPTNMPPPNLAIQSQIILLEQQIHQEISAFLTTSQQMQVVRILQNELAQLRAINTNRAAPGPSSNHLNPTGPPNFSLNPSLPHSQHLTSYQPVTTNSNDQPLPDGMTLPPGWSLLPLQVAQTHNQNHTSSYGGLSSFSSSAVPSSTLQPSSTSRPSLSAPELLSTPLPPTFSIPGQPHPTPPETGAFEDSESHSPRPKVQEWPLSMQDEARATPESEGETLHKSQTEPLFSKSSHGEPHSDIGGSSTTILAPEVRAAKGKSKAATVEDVEE